MTRLWAHLLILFLVIIVYPLSGPRSSRGDCNWLRCWSHGRPIQGLRMTSRYCDVIVYCAVPILYFDISVSFSLSIVSVMAYTFNSSSFSFIWNWWTRALTALQQWAVLAQWRNTIYTFILHCTYQCWIFIWAKFKSWPNGGSYKWLCFEWTHEKLVDFLLSHPLRFLVLHSSMYVLFLPAK